MNPLAIEQAYVRLERAKKAAKALASATCYEEQEDAWTTYLLAVNSIFSKLEQGAKGSPHAQGWFGRMKNTRRKDPLLSYLHFARNSDEHGVARITEKSPGFQFLPITTRFAERHPVCVFIPTKPIYDFPKSPEEEPKDGTTNHGYAAGARIKCVKVVDDRFNDYREPPGTHLGESINMVVEHSDGPKSYPVTDFVDVLAEAALPFFEQMICDAEKHCS